MNKFNRSLGVAALFVMMLALVSGQALAQRNGGGNNPPGTPLVFDFVAKVNGTTPTWSGDFVMAAPALIYGVRTTNLSFSIRGKNLNLPDGTKLYVNLETSDSVTGDKTDTSKVNYHCMAAPMGVLAKLGIVKAYHNFFDDLTLKVIRKLDRITITDANGTVLASAHP